MSVLSSMRVTIVGLGMMGGSLAMALRPHVAHLTAVDVDEATREMALDTDLVDRATVDLEGGVRDADLLILAVPVGSIISILGQVPALRPDGCLVLDLGSTKGAICRAMGRLPQSFEALGGHPMCGKEVSGLRAAEADLYREQTFVLCRTRRTTPRAEAVCRAVVESVGATPLFLEPADHDRLVAVVSHLPYFVASLLMQRAAEAAREDARIWPVSASGFRDTSRLSGSGPEMFLDIVRTNREAILEQLYAYRGQLQEVIHLLQEGDDEAVRSWMAARHEEHQAYRRER